MKTKIVLLIAISAVITLSFTFAKRTPATSKSKHESAQDAPIGGFALEDKI